MARSTHYHIADSGMPGLSKTRCGITISDNLTMAEMKNVTCRRCIAANGILQKTPLGSPGHDSDAREALLRQMAIEAVKVQRIKSERNIGRAWSADPETLKEYEEALAMWGAVEKWLEGPQP